MWNPGVVPKQPVLAVAAYSALLLAGLQAFSAECGAAYARRSQNSHKGSKICFCNPAIRAWLPLRDKCINSRCGLKPTPAR